MQVLKVRHLLDPMHIEVNVCKSLIKHLYGVNDCEALRKDLKVAKVHKNAWIKTRVLKEGDIVVRKWRETPPARWVLPSSTLKQMNMFMSSIRFPTGYGAKLRGSCTTVGRDGNLTAKPPHGLKSHDYHKMMQHILPLAIRTCVEGPDTKDLRETIYELSSLFR